MRRDHDGDGVFYGISLQEVHRNLCTAQSVMLVHTLRVACGESVHFLLEIHGHPCPHTVFGE
jgi:hypothetical protein